MTTHSEEPSGLPTGGESRAERHGPRPALAATPIPAPAPEAPAPRPARGGRRRLVLPIVLLAALAALTFGVRQWLYSRHHIATDNAQVEGHIGPVLPKGSGY